MEFRRRAAPVVACLIAAALLSAALPAASAPPAVDADNATAGNYGWFQGGHRWRGQFADPSVAVLHGVYYVYSSGAGGRYLGVQTSTDLVHWLAHAQWSKSAPPWSGGPDPHSDPSIPSEIRHSSLSSGDIYNLNDALVAPAKWGVPHNYNGWMMRDYWAVGVIRIGTTWFAYAPVQYSKLMGDGTADPEGFGRFCLTIAKAHSPLGPFRDISGSSPFYCDVDPGGSIDPAPYYDAHMQRYWLTWKANGRLSRPGVSGYPSALKTVRLDANGMMMGHIATLLTTAPGTWEGNTIENPSMIKYANRWYLFYSGNWFGADRAGHSPYATGYAICAGPAGPCHRPSSKPLLASTGASSGPGGASAFLDVDGGLHLAYASYYPGEYRTNTPIPQPRRMHIVALVAHADGTLAIAP